jgi:hypothetical protein
VTIAMSIGPAARIADKARVRNWWVNGQPWQIRSIEAVGAA